MPSLCPVCRFFVGPRGTCRYPALPLIPPLAASLLEWFPAFDSLNLFWLDFDFSVAFPDDLEGIPLVVLDS